MSSLTPRRRRAAVVAACAAVVPSTTLLIYQTKSSPLHFIGGLIIGVAAAAAFGMTLKRRSACS